MKNMNVFYRVVVYGITQCSIGDIEIGLYDTTPYGVTLVTLHYIPGLLKVKL